MGKSWWVVTGWKDAAGPTGDKLIRAGVFTRSSASACRDIDGGVEDVHGSVSA